MRHAIWELVGDVMTSLVWIGLMVWRVWVGDLVGAGVWACAQELTYIRWTLKRMAR